MPEVAATRATRHLTAAPSTRSNGDGVEFVGGVSNVLAQPCFLSGGAFAVTRRLGQRDGRQLRHHHRQRELGAGTNAFNNRAGGLFNAGATVDLGRANQLTNAGNLSPGGAGVVRRRR